MITGGLGVTTSTQQRKGNVHDNCWGGGGGVKFNSLEANVHITCCVCIPSNSFQFYHH